MKMDVFLSLFVALLISTVFSSNLFADIRLTTLPAYSQSAGMLVRIRPTFDFPEQNHEFKYLLARTPNDNSGVLLRDWGSANFDWDTSGYIPGYYNIKVLARSIDNPANTVEYDYKRYELVSHTPVTSLRVVMNPINAQAIGSEVSVTAIAKVGDDLAIPPNDMDLEYRFYVILPDGVTRTFLSGWIYTRGIRWNTSSYQQGVYQLGVEVRRRNSGVQTYEYTRNMQYTLSNNIAISSVDISTNVNESPQTVGTKVTLNARAETSSDGVVPEFIFRIRPANMFSFETICDWSTDSRCVWNTEDYRPGKHIIVMYARQQDIDTTPTISKSIGFWLNNLQFENTTEAAGLEHIGESWGGAWGDVNNDGLPDIWITNHRQTPALYYNNGDGTFDDVTSERLITKWRTDAHGTQWSDFDNDGDQDLIQTGGGFGTSNGSKNLLYINRDGYFTNESDERGVSYPEMRGRGATWVDWNKDGRLDLFLTGHSPINNFGNRLFIQQDGGIFFDQTASHSIPEHLPGAFALPTRVSGIDYALIISYLTNFPLAIHHRENASEQLEVADQYNNVFDAAFNDFNGDSTIDVFLSRNLQVRQNYATKDTGVVYFNLGSTRKNTDIGLSFRSSGTMTFQLVLPRILAEGLYIGERGLSADEFDTATIPNREHCTITLDPEDQRVWGLSDQRSQNPYGAYIGYDPDLDRWLMITHNRSHQKYSSFGGQIISEFVIEDFEEINFDPPIDSPEDILLLRNEMNEFVMSESSFPIGTHSLSVVSGDFDNDMDVDIYTIQSQRIKNLMNVLYVNMGNGSFQVLPVSNHLAGGTNEGYADTVLKADYDVDGFLDLLVFNGQGNPPHSLGPRQLFRNLGNSNNWIEIDLQGTTSNRDGIESVLYAHTPDGKTQIRERNGGVHSKGQNDKRIHFGLGKNRTVDIEVHWPSGIVQNVHNLSANQVIEIVESETQDN
jgi:hypothetical protein